MGKPEVMAGNLAGALLTILIGLKAVALVLADQDITPALNRPNFD